MDCTADSNPEIEHYIWTDVTKTSEGRKNQVLQAGQNASTLRISKEWTWIGNVTVRCTVRTTIHYNEYFASEEITIKVNGESEPMNYIKSRMRMGCQKWKLVGVRVFLF